VPTARPIVLGSNATADLADHPVEVGEELRVHLCDSGLPGRLGVVDEGEGPTAVLVQLG